MTQSIRFPEIIEIARRDGKVTVESLAEHFGVTHQTIRRDLTDLAEAGRLERVHGGAVLPSGVRNMGYEHRRGLNAGAKDAMAAACAAEIPNDCSVMLAIGTSAEAVAGRMLDHRNILAVTNNVNVASTLAANPTCRIVMSAGLLRPADGGIVGDLAVDTVRRFRFDVAVVGCSALDEDGDILDFDMQEIAVTRAILEQARRVFLVADHSKFTRTAPVRAARLSDIDVLFTDRDPPGPFTARCAEAGVSLRIVGP